MLPPRFLAAVALSGVLSACGSSLSQPAGTPAAAMPAAATPGTAPLAAAFTGVQKAYNSPVLNQGRPLTFFLGAEY